MRTKKLQCVITFKTTTEAMAFEEVAQKAGLSGRLIPVPREITAGCGFAWRENPSFRVSVETLLREKNLGFDGIYELVI